MKKTRETVQQSTITFFYYLFHWRRSGKHDQGFLPVLPRSGQTWLIGFTNYEPVSTEFSLFRFVVFNCGTFIGRTGGFCGKPE